MFKYNVSTVVPSLLLSGSPPAVAGFVVAIVVYAIYLVALFIAISHVGYEVVYIEPSVAYLYATTAISGIAFVFWVCAAGNHVSPNIKKRLTPSSVLSRCLSLKAPAALRGSISKTVTANIARWTATRTLGMGKEGFNTFFFVNTKHCVPAKNVSDIHHLGLGRNHIAAFV